MNDRKCRGPKHEPVGELPDDLKADISGLCNAAILNGPEGLCHSIHERIHTFANTQTRQALERVMGYIADDGTAVTFRASIQYRSWLIEQIRELMKEYE